MAFDESVPRYAEASSDAELSAGFLPEIDGEYGDQLALDWMDCVVRGLGRADGEKGSGISCG